MQPKARTINPDQQRMIEDLLRDPKTVMCPICGERGFWDNREGKKNPKSPDWKCKNKACVGATPMKGKNSFAVWMPEDFTETPAPSSKRLPSPPDTRSTGQKIIDAAVPPDDEPPAFHRDVPLPDSPDGELFVAPVEASPKEQAYYALALRVAAFQKKVSHAYEAPFDLASINAMTFSIFNRP